MPIIIKPSAAIRQNYNEIAALCRSTQSPVFLTKNGEGDLVVMDIETFNRREAALQLCKDLSRIEDMRSNGIKDIPAEEVSQKMRAAVKEVCNV